MRRNIFTLLTLLLATTFLVCSCKKNDKGNKDIVLITELPLEKRAEIANRYDDIYMAALISMVTRLSHASMITPQSSSSFATVWQKSI